MKAREKRFWQHHCHRVHAWFLNRVRQNLPPLKRTLHDKGFPGWYSQLCTQQGEKYGYIPEKYASKFQFRYKGFVIEMELGPFRYLREIPSMDIYNEGVPEQFVPELEALIAEYTRIKPLIDWYKHELFPVNTPTQFYRASPQLMRYMDSNAFALALRYINRARVRPKPLAPEVRAYLTMLLLTEPPPNDYGT